MKVYFLDTKSILAFLENAPGANSVEELIWKAVQDKHRICLPVTSWGEVLSAIWVSHGKQFAEEVETRLHHLPIELIPIDASIAKAAVVLSAKLHVACNECLALAAAQQKKAVFVTTDSALANSELGIRIQIVS